jgi:hypothetical protein
MRPATVQRCWRRVLGGAAVARRVMAFGHTETQAQQHKPNILVITLPQARHVQWDAQSPLPRNIPWIALPAAEPRSRRRPLSAISDQALISQMPWAPLPQSILPEVADHREGADGMIKALLGGPKLATRESLYRRET